MIVTWANLLTFTVSLSGPALVPPGGTGTYTALANKDVGPTPYYIEIFDETEFPTYIGGCGTGTSCKTTYQPPTHTPQTLVAFIASPNNEWPFWATSGNVDLQASSHLLSTVQGQPIG